MSCSVEVILSYRERSSRILIQWFQAVARFLERWEHLAKGGSPRKISRYNGFLDAPRASQNVQFYRSFGRISIEKIGVY